MTTQAEQAASALGEPAAWRWRHRDAPEALAWNYAASDRNLMDWDEIEVEPLYPASALQALALKVEEVERENQRLNDRNIEASMLSYKWMCAHDLLKAGEPYDYPRPADVPKAEARAQAAEALLARAGVSLEKLLAMHGTDADHRQAASLLAEIRGTQAAGVEGE